MTDQTERDEDIALAAEYALGLLTPAEADAFEARLAVDPAFRADYALWAADFAAMTDEIPEAVPPKAIKAGLEARLFAVEKRSLWQRIGLVPALLGGVAVAAVLFVVVSTGVLTPPDTSPGPDFRAEIAAGDSSLVALASYDAAAGTLRIERRAGSAREGRALELWLIVGAAAPVSLGVLAEDQVTELALSPDISVALEDAILAISDEPPGGSPTGAPTGEVLATGAVATL